MSATGHDVRPAEVAAIFKALSDPNRLAIFELVRASRDEARSPEETAQSISRIASQFDLSLSTVSHHIKELRSAGLIRCEKVGQTVYCQPDRRALEAIERFLGQGGAV